MSQRDANANHDEDEAPETVKTEAASEEDEEHDKTDAIAVSLPVFRPAPARLLGSASGGSGGRFMAVRAPCPSARPHHCNILRPLPFAALKCPILQDPPSSPSLSLAGLQEGQRI